MTSGIYRITHTESGTSYVGSAKHIPTRWRGHRKLLNRGRHHSTHLQYAWIKYGYEAFEFAVIEVTGMDALLPREQSWIEHYRSVGRVYNIRLEASSNRGVPRVFSEAHKAALSMASRGKKKSPEHIAALSAVRKGMNRGLRPPEVGAKISAALKGRKRTPEQCEQMSIVRLGKRLSPERRASCTAVLLALADARRGKPLTEEHKANLRAAKAKRRSNLPVQTPGKAGRGRAFEQGNNPA